MLHKIKSTFKYDDSEMPLLSHLEAFRKMVIRLIIAIILGMGVMAFFVPTLLEWLRAPAQEYIDKGMVTFQFLEAPSGFKMWMMLAFWSGLLVMMPVIMMIVGAFILPGVKPNERRVFLRISFFSGILFIVGVLMGYHWTLPLAMKWFLDVNSTLGGVNNLTYPEFITLLLQILLGFGVAFQMPLVIILLGRLDFVRSKQLRQKRRHVIVGLFVLAMILTPPDVTSQILMALPLILLYEFCIWFLFFTEKKKIEPTNESGTESN